MVKLCCTKDYCNSNEAIAEVVKNVKNFTIPRKKEGKYGGKGGRKEGGGEREGRRVGGRKEGRRRGGGRVEMRN